MFHDIVLVKLYHQSFNVFFVMSWETAILYFVKKLEMRDCDKLIWRNIPEILLHMCSPPSSSTRSRFEIGGIGDHIRLIEVMTSWWMVDGILCEPWEIEPWEQWEIRAMPFGSLQLRTWRRNGQSRLYVVRVDAYTAWSNWDDGLEKGEDWRMKGMEGKMEA